MQDFTRRRIIASSLLALGAIATEPLKGANLEPAFPEWIARLEEALRGFSTRISRSFAASGEIELHCEMPDPFVFGTSHGNLAGLGVRVLAVGNRLSFQREGVRVTIVLNIQNPLSVSPA